MAYKLLTLDGFVSLEQALDDDDNVLPRLQYPWQMDDLDVALKMREDEIRDLVRWHLGVPWAYVSGMDSWRRGSFNRAIPVYVPLDGDQDGRRIWIRFPLPYKIGEASHPGNAREKLETEVATYIWLQDNCPDVPIPTLYGFGLGDGARVSTCM